MTKSNITKQPDSLTLERAAMMFNALGDPARLNLLLHLRQGERCVNELAELENAKVGSISARLKTLYQSHLVQKRRDAKYVYYSLADRHIAELLDNMLIHANECIYATIHQSK
ncbi:metalloregulator ArsR/SmtB family transcription factor [Pasteurella skyensis]|uniref:Metalloregulator ArsR/SmtB family transcription factor n=1 Tax=Phocoenobacter skyensis TaxID=97481 RepID=A0AAJ6N874_9PAST|nr:metalloregulator ArsR/SmtB family transcription factor [Pasteurella skyensis]MDP8161854.1 metalloregulator ArsR/SmtB family transcription factor [Pasteurella skyensis]MDP8172010.1 metalloregulator ArsR/SmtB family transcription factor [Pasteurella skyensis]MDP8176245.1 metalloregulator ArsR/SmtB family transcription factor [Pasteurella skyensis]MDP8178265.1 metalloregulator ArsR/SmtB family transcription factor [Pasteurella skyensis]MDP8182127.1 metalloregulator ArsR/SmtB family transcripti